MSGVTYIQDVVVTCRVWEHEVEMGQNLNQELRFSNGSKEDAISNQAPEKKRFWWYMKLDKC